MVYATWDYYSKYYGTVTDETEFNRLANRASRKLDSLTAQRASKAIGYKADALQEAVCNMVEYIQSAEAASLGKGLNSVTNDGYTESYAATTPEMVEDSLRSIAFQWLSGTGLMGAVAL